MKKILLSLGLLAGLQLSANAQVTLGDMPYWRPYDQRGINVFESSKADTIVFDGIKVRIGGGFAQQFQGLEHSNTATAKFDANEKNVNKLIEIGKSFNLATANMNMDVLLADGVRLNLILYLSSRHHSETWVKGGYIQIDKLAFLNSPMADRLMENLTLRVGHMEVNYGDAHYRRTDGAQALQNPFVGNYIMDAFATEIGADVTFQKNGFLAVAGVTGGEIQGGITKPGERAPSYIGKIGYDSNLTEKLRLRLTGSVYTTNSSVRNTLYGGDRTGSRYYLVLENEQASTSANFTSGRFNPGLTDNITSMVINPFVKFGGLEFFGNFERAKGKAANETEDRTWDQIGTDLLYRFGARENFYLGGRYNKVSGPLAGSGTEVNIQRTAFGAGWFVTKNILAKAEYVTQEYNGFPANHIYNGGKFNGIMLEGAISF